MQKVEGSSPFIRSQKSPANRGFFLVPTAIADVLNLSDRRVNSILRDLKAAA